MAKHYSDPWQKSSIFGNLFDRGIPNPFEKWPNSGRAGNDEEEEDPPMETKQRQGLGHSPQYRYSYRYYSRY